MKTWNGQSKNGFRALVGLLVAGSLGVAGCASIMGKSSIDAERTMAAAGFQMKLADTPEKLAHLETMEPQRQLVPHLQDGETRYIWADSKYCKCMYAGSELAYQRYQRLAIQQKLANQQVEAANAYQSASMNWGMWGPWGGWY